MHHTFMANTVYIVRLEAAVIIFYSNPQMLLQQKRSCDAMNDEKNKLITDFQQVKKNIYHSAVSIFFLSLPLPK